MLYFINSKFHINGKCNGDITCFINSKLHIGGKCNNVITCCVLVTVSSILVENVTMI